MPGEIRVKGLPELERAFATMAVATRKEVKAGLRSAAEPVRTSAETNASGRILNMGTGRWSRMRLGSNRGMVVYVAPRARRRGGSPRPNLAPLLLDRAMIPALGQHRDEVQAKLALAVEAAAKTAGF